MTELTPGPIIRRFLSGDLDEAGAVRELLRLDPHQYPGLSVSGELTSDQRTRLEHLSQILSWESAKRLAPETIPDVPYGSPEYHAFIASVPRTRFADDEGR
jgi:hypothetical protein